MSNNPANIRLSACRVRWGGRDLGLTKGGVDVTIKTDVKTIMVDQFGNTPVDDIVLGRGITVKTPFAETDLDTLYAIMRQSGAVMTDQGTKATGTLTFSSAPNNNDTVTINGHVFTFVTTTPALNQVLIGGSVAATIANLAGVISLCSDPNVLNASYVAGASTLAITFYRSGVAGNTFTMASSTGAITVSAPTLAGGTDGYRSVTMSNSVGVSLLQSALPLVLHPYNLADNDTSEDVTIPLAGQSGNVTFAYKIDNERIYMVEFTGYPNYLASNALVIFGNTTTNGVTSAAVASSVAAVGNGYANIVGI